MGACQGKGKAQASAQEPAPAETTGKKSGDKPASQASAPAGAATKQQVKVGPGGSRDVMGKYLMLMSKEDIMGEGTSSICRRGTTKDGKTQVAIKVYKEQNKGGGKLKEVTLQKFKRQIEVLKDLLLPFKEPDDKKLWHESMSKVEAGSVFMQLLDYSKTAKGEPGPDTSDGVLYVVTELAQFSLKDFLAHRREQRQPLTSAEVKTYTKSIMVAMAGLHAKGYVHIDMKPENMMMFDGKLKVIDVDGCVRKGTKVSIQDSSISFSPCYCAPEWARFLIKDSQPNIIAGPALDVWSVGMTVCELVTLDAILKPQYANFLRNASSHREAGFLFMEWLSSLRKSPVPRSIDKFDKQFAELMTNWLLVCNGANRKSCAQALGSPFILSCPDIKVEVPKDEGKEIARTMRSRPEDDSVEKPLHQGTLWKLNSGGDPKDAQVWIKRDMWIGHNHSLCYFSKKEDKRLVLIDAVKLHTGTIVEVESKAKFAKDFAFEVRCKVDAEEAVGEIIRLAAESKAELEAWLYKLKETSNLDVIVTMKLGQDMEKEINEFKLKVKNRRMQVGSDADHEHYEPLFKDKLWKLKTEGDNKKPEDWFQREMWIAKNGSLVYFSPKDDKQLIYYTASDVQSAKVETVLPGETCKKFAFKVTLPPINGVEFTPGEFAADSEAARNQWISNFQNFKGA